MRILAHASAMSGLLLFFGGWAPGAETESASAVSFPVATAVQISQILDRALLKTQDITPPPRPF